MQKIFFNKYTDWTTDLTYTESQRPNLSYYTIREYSESEFNKIVEMWIEEVKRLINNII